MGAAGQPEELARFLRENMIPLSDFEASGMQWDVLCAIREHHRANPRTTELLSAGRYCLDLLQTVPAVHSLRIRVKDPDHLLEKIIRKRRKYPQLEITVGTYDQCITDLIAIRALHLFKDEWLQIHSYVTKTWEPMEQPTAYVRAGDDTEPFEKEGCRVELHERGYRSIHYLLKTQPRNRVQPIELQVRTLFDEAWCEIDHKLRYPRQSFDPTLIGYLDTFNRLAGLGDEMGMYAKNLSAALRVRDEALGTALRARDDQVAEADRQQQAQEEELRGMLSQLHIAEKDKAELQKKLDALQKTYQSAREVRLDVGKLAAIETNLFATFPNVYTLNPSVSGSRT